jgi:hypothetical protein
LHRPQEWQDFWGITVLDLEYYEDMTPEASRFAKVSLFFVLALTVFVLGCFAVCAITAQGLFAVGATLAGKWHVMARPSV